MPNRSDRNLAIERLLREGRGAPAGPASGTCVTAEELAAWVDGGLVAADAARVEAHLTACPACQALLGAFASTETVSETGRSRGLTRALLPLAAAAVLVVGVWLAGTRRQDPPTVAEPAESQLARVEALPAPAPTPATPPAAGAESPQRAERPTDRQKENRLDRSAARSEQSASAPAAFREEARERESSAGAGPAEEKAAAAPPAAPPAATAPAPAQAAADAAAEVDLARAQPRDAVAGPQAPRAGVPANARLAAASAKLVDARLPVSSPDGTSRWRIVGSSLETSADGGATWLAAAGVTPAELADVTGGASPARGVSWLVGRGGLVLVTADGRRFTRTSAPAPALLVGVEAVDGATAEVRASDGRRWRTTNAGRTWMPVR